MHDDSYRQKLVEEVTGKVEQRPATHEPRPEVQARAEQAVDRLLDAPIQAFVPLLAENAVISDLQRSRHG